MRISTKSIYEAGANQMNSLQSQLARTQMQLSTNRRILTPSDDPIASSRALEVTQSRSINTQLVTNRDNAKNFLGQEELALKNTYNLIADVQTLVVNAGNGSLTDDNRESLAVELEGRLNDLMALANTSDGAGGYLFSGFKSTTQPYTSTATGAAYAGDQGQRQLQVGPSRMLAVSDSGTEVFDSNLTGNGVFATGGATTNRGSGVISRGVVTDATLLTGHSYSIDFTGTDDPLNYTLAYTVTDVTTGLTVPDPAVPTAFASGQAIAFDGLQFNIEGKPKGDEAGPPVVAGDQFTVVPSTKEPLFATLKNLLTVIRTPNSSTPAGQANLTNGLNAAHDTLDTAYNNVLSLVTDVGARGKELDYLDSAGSDLDIQFAATLSDLQDLDYYEASSLYAQQQITLQAAQKSFTMMSGLSLFNYIG
ncbi:MAG: flagellar hook-associated protein FlgL [Burkholderiaceae bacterium]|nr:flagellar hook-associated protein FlgL [Burkholderiaceae bacterium]